MVSGIIVYTVGSISRRLTPNDIPYIARPGKSSLSLSLVMVTYIVLRDESTKRIISSNINTTGKKLLNGVDCG